MPDIRPDDLTLERVQRAFSGRYRITRLLGSGGMATVFVAHDEKLRRDVAVKVFRPDLAATIGVERFMRETEIAAGLNHPHIVHLLDRGEVDGLLYYVMPLIGGETLREVLRREQQIPAADTQRYLRDIVEALEYAHGQGLVHRDIKPENVLVSGRSALVTDFGIARVLATEGSTEGQLTAVGVPIGTPTYMSPEQALGEAGIDHRSDIYSVGVLAYELLTGQPPFSGPALRLLTAHLTEVPQEIAERQPAVPARMASIVMRCLAKKPEERYASTAELLADIEGATVVDAPGRARRPRPGGRRRVVALGAIAVLIALAAAVTLLQRRTPNEPAAVRGRIVVLPFTNRSGDPSLGEIGGFAAEWVTQGLNREEIGEAMPAATVARMLAALPADAPDPVATLLRETRAEVVVSGSITVENDSVVMIAQAQNATSGEMISASMPVRSATVTDAVATMAQRIEGLLASYFNFGESVFRVTPPPSMDVYHELVAGREAFYGGAFAEAIRRFERITELEPQYVPHIALLAAAHYWLGHYATADSLLRSALAAPGRLTSNERLNVEYMLAWVAGDLETEYRTAQQRSSADPSFVYNYANAALRTNRPAAALEIFRSADLDSPLASLWAALWAIPPTAHHMLGSYDEALVSARQAGSAYPGEIGIANLELDALAALGAAASIDSLLDLAQHYGSAFNGPPMDTPGWSMIEASLELRAHGFDDAAARVIDRALDWYASALAMDSTPRTLHTGRAIATYVAGDWAGAGEQFERLLREDSTNIDHAGYLGVIAARRGDGERARSYDRQLAALDGTYLYGRHTRWRARIAAVLGEPDRSLALLQDAFADGISLALGQDWFWLHVDPDLAALRDHPAFIAFTAPRPSR